MKRIFTIETGLPDSNGDVINLDGIKIPDKVLMIEDFDRTKPLGYAEVKREGNELKATADVPDKYLDRYPAIGFVAVSYRFKDCGRIYDEIVLQNVGLSEKGNTNPDIKTIREQTESE